MRGYVCRFAVVHNLKKHALRIHGKMTLALEENKSTGRSAPPPLKAVPDKAQNLENHVSRIQEIVTKNVTGSSILPFKPWLVQKEDTNLKSATGKTHNWPCQQCDRKASSKKNLLRHVKIVHDKVKDFDCKFCDYKTAVKHNLKKHDLRIHEPHDREKDFSCTFCNYRAFLKSDLHSHEKAIHLKEKDIKCHFCSYQTAQQWHMKRHVEAIHNKLRDFACELCNLKFSQKQNLRMHVRTVHEGKRDLSCKHCEYKTAYKRVLENHWKKHHHDSVTIVKQNHADDYDKTETSNVEVNHHKLQKFACTSCSLKFSLKQNLKIHMRTVHERKGDLSCKHCEYTTAYMRVLENHWEKHHHVADTTASVKQTQNKAEAGNKVPLIKGENVLEELTETVLENFRKKLKEEGQENVLENIREKVEHNLTQLQQKGVVL